MRPDVRAGVRWRVAMRPGKCWELVNDFNEAVIEESKNLRASACAEVEHPFRFVERACCSPNRITTCEEGGKSGFRSSQGQPVAAVGKGEGGLRNGPCGHIQPTCGALSGPRKPDDGTVLPNSERKLNVRWQPPLAITLKELAGELPATIGALAFHTKRVR